MNSPVSNQLGLDPLWTTQDPKAPGVYRWRKSWQWDDVEREVRLSTEGVLVTYAHRYAQWAPLNRVGGEWLLAEPAVAGQPVKFFTVK